MSISREAIYSALFTLVQSATGFTNGSRRWRHIQEVKSAELPALFQVQLEEVPTQVKGVPPIFTLSVDLYLYVQTTPQVGGDAILPSTQLNNALDAIENALAPDPVTGVQTLGGLVSHAWMGGRVQTDEGTLGDRGMAIVRIEMKVEGGVTTSGTFMFDSGFLFFQPDPTQDPIEVVSLQEISVDAKFQNNEERGNLQFPVVTMSKLNSLNFKAKMAKVTGKVLNQVVFSQTPSTGSTNVQANQTGAIPANPGPYTVTPSVPAGGTWSSSLGVIYRDGANVGIPLVKVASSPAVGQYSVSAGVYTFAAADAGRSVSFSYLYTKTTGSQLSLANQFQQPAALFKAVLTSQSKTGQVTWILNACRSDALNLLTRLEDHNMPDFGFSAQADSAGVMGTMSYSS